MKKTVVLLVITFIVMLYGNKQEYVQIPVSSIRIRVIAKSDSTKDQNDKIIIKNALEEEIYKLIGKNMNYDNVDAVIKDNEDNLNAYIDKKMKENNIDSTFTTNYGYNYFPEKTFKDLKYDAGIYKSYVVTLGNGEGENWWCVLYPPLCLIDENVDNYEYHSLIKDTIAKYN